MTVTQIEPFYKGKGRVAIYLNNEFAFVLYKGELSKYGIEVGSFIDDNLYRRILDEILILRAKKRGMNLLMKMDRTVNDVRGKLAESGYPKEAIDEAIKYLESFNYLDDYRYAASFIRSKQSGMSQKLILQKLVNKGIDKAIIDKVLLELEEDSVEAQIELINKLINKRLKGCGADISYEDKQKLFAYLYNKGFSIRDIEDAYSEYCSKVQYISQ